MAFRRRLLVLLLLTSAGLAVVWVRMISLQIVFGDAARRRAEAATRRTEPVLGRRGRILDAKGDALATDRSVPRLVFVPSEWASRERYRCSQCGDVLFARTPRHFDRDGRPVVPPRACSCGAGRAALAPVADEDLEPLESALHLPVGTLVEAAEARMEMLRRRIAVATADRVLGRERGVYSVARDRAREFAARLGAKGARVRDAAVDAVLAELEPELLDRAVEAEDVRSEERTDRYGRPVVMTEFDGPAGTTLYAKRLPPEAERLLEMDRAGRYRGFRAELARERWYPHHGLLAQVVGVTGTFASPDELRSYRERYGADTVLPDTRIGRMGLEARYDEELRGEPGVVVREKDEAGAFANLRVVKAPTKGLDLTLWAEAAACEEAHRIVGEAATQEGYGGGGGACGALVALDAETGHLVAWGEAPVFDLDGSLDEITTRIDDGDGGLRDVVPSEAAAAAGGDEPVFFTSGTPKPPLTLSRVARIAIEPGSAIKPMTALALLASGHPIPSAYECTGGRHGPNDRPSCHAVHGAVGLVEMLVHSCNRYCADGASDRAYAGQHRELVPAWARRLGLGCPTGVDLVGDGIGAYPAAPDASRLRQIAIGQSITATPLQMARMMCLIANGRRLPFPRIVARVGDALVRDGGVDVELDPGALAKVRLGMRGCVESGTAKHRFEGKAGLDGVTVYGKTGSAEATGPDWTPEGADISEYPGPWHLWFVGYATKPGTPTIAFAVVLHARKEGVGGDLAAPLAQRFLSWWYAR